MERLPNAATNRNLPSMGLICTATGRRMPTTRSRRPRNSSPASRCVVEATPAATSSAVSPGRFPRKLDRMRYGTISPAVGSYCSMTTTACAVSLANSWPPAAFSDRVATSLTPTNVVPFHRYKTDSGPA
eukprot:1732984-Rhodomonas_salina.4